MLQNTFTWINLLIPKTWINEFRPSYLIIEICVFTAVINCFLFMLYGNLPERKIGVSG